MPEPEHPSPSLTARTQSWLTALEARHTADLRFAEVTRALRALSSAYVERRDAGGPRGALESAGKRAAFALFYAPLHFIATDLVVRNLGAHLPAPARIVDLGCGTGVAGAAWALSRPGPSALTGLDRHPWAIEETRWTYAQLGLTGRAAIGDLSKAPRLSPGDAIIAAYVLNELTEPARRRAEAALTRYASSGVQVLILEPISRRAVPWWDATAERLAAVGFRADEWRLPIERPEIVARLDQAAGLDHRTLALRSLYRGAEPITGA
jgi:Methyltransferase domain